MRSVIVSFPGSNRERDAARAIQAVSGRPPVMADHRADSLPDCDLIVLPGGFSYGDYLRCGAMAATAPVLAPIRAAARRGVRVLGICNGFQILTEAGLLPGALIRNAGLGFLCQPVRLTVETSHSPFTRAYARGAEITVPIAHHDGNFVAEADLLARLNDEDRVAFRYAQSVNGSTDRIAGVLNAERNVLGLMPHPENAIEAGFGGTDGLGLFRSLVDATVGAA